MTQVDQPDAHLRVRLEDSFELPIGRAEAFRLFTPRGERDWAEGWDPEFFGDVADDAQVGTVFRTGADTLRTTWVVVESVPEQRLRYARLDHRGWMGTVAVTLEDRSGGCLVVVAYDLTATAPGSSSQLSRFASDYPAYIASWRAEIIDHALAGR